MKKTLAFLLLLVLTLSLVPGIVFAGNSQPTEPAHAKKASANGDGTYKLELSVTGDANTTATNDSHVNVLIVYDESSSMNNAVPDSDYSRADIAENAMYSFVNGLNEYKNDGVDIYAAVLGFGTGVDERVGWTDNLDSVGALFDEGLDGQTVGTHAYASHNGTNWAAALTRAGELIDGLSDDRKEYDTFVILVTDGGPTMGGSGGTTVPSATAPFTNYRSHYMAAVDPAYDLQSRENVKLYGIYAFGTDANLLDDLMYYANKHEHRESDDGYSIVDATQAQHDFGEDEWTSADGDNYFNANTADELNKAIEKIFNEIISTLGITEVGISDGTTSEVTTSTGVAELLEVDESSYEYWLSVKVVDGAFSYTDQNTGEVTTYHVTENNGTCTVTGGASDITVEGTVSSGVFKFKWDKATELSNNQAPPEAKLNGSSVDWNLSGLGLLLDGVTYSVTFDVYPSQTTLDIVADLLNDPSSYDDLDSEIKKYIDENGNLSTNTTATLTYKDTREENPETHSTSFTNPDAVSNSAVQSLMVSKEWENEIDKRDQPAVTLKVTRDGEPVYTVTLGPNDDEELAWKDSVYISVGIMKDGKPLEGSEGHDFTFVEEPGESGITYYWELNAPTVHPMLINNKAVMLIKADEKHQAPDGADTYEINGEKYYVDEEIAGLTAVNERRSRLFLSKTVEGNDVPEDAVFPFTINVANPKAPETAPSEEDDPKHDSDWWIWISVWDQNSEPVTEGVEGATHAGSGWWYGATGTDITIPVGAGYSILINNLPTDTTYTITEGDLPAGFTYKETKLTIEGEGTDSTFSGGKKTTGTIESTNSEYYVEFINKYDSVSVTVDKVWDDASDKYKVRPEELTLTLNGASKDVTVPDPTVTKDGDTWTYVWAGLPKFDTDGKEIEYTVTEDEVPAGYALEDDAPVKDGGKITNTFEPCLGDPPVKKVLKGDKPAKDETFKFKLTAVSTTAEGLEGKMPMPEAAEGAQEMTVEVVGEGEKEFGEFPFVVPGKYTYTITEVAGDTEGYTYSDEVHTIVYDVKVGEDNKLTCVKTVDGVEITGDETDEANVSKFTFTNEYKKPVVSIKVTKVWDDNNNEELTRPDSVKVKLYADGKDTGKTLELSKAVDWAGTFEDLDKFNADGKEIKYTVDEAEIPEGYVADVTGDMTKGFTITNSKDVPPTGDVSNVLFWSGLSLTSLLGLGYLFIRHKREEQ